MRVAIEPGALSGTITAPPSKSATQRALACALLHNGLTTIRNSGNSEDERASLHIIETAGCIVDQFPERILVQSNGGPTGASEYSCGESGLAARMFLPILAGTAPTITMNGSGGLLRRQLGNICPVLGQLGISIKTNGGCMPIELSGEFVPGDVHMDGSESSQLLTGILFALTAHAKTPVTVYVRELASKPYIDMTLSFLRKMGRPVAHDDYKAFFIDPSHFTTPEELVIDVEGDWSSAAFFLVGGAVAGQVRVRHLSSGSTQADKAILQVLQDAGANVQIDADGISVSQAPLQAFETDASDCPDLFPILSILAACCRGESAITGLRRLFHKESNRVESIGEMLLRFEVPFSMEDDTLYVTGRTSLSRFAQIDTYHDHRIEMAAAIGALRAKGRVNLRHAGSHTKSYPAFWNDLKQCGAVFQTT
jgi:3-phosphoshikimate 1-carboxyvinyltransferase